MAGTKYEVLYRYYNVDMKMPITNVVNERWVSCFDEEKAGDGISKETFMFCTEKDPDLERTIQDLLIYGNSSFNPKFNMLFIYRGREMLYSSKSTDEPPFVLMDSLERICVSPWFVHSTHASLSSAMTKVKALANVIGHENVKIGKVVNLEQYIEIV